jgi:hypothetical protein
MDGMVVVVEDLVYCLTWPVVLDSVKNFGVVKDLLFSNTLVIVVSCFTTGTLLSKHHLRITISRSLLKSIQSPL